MIDNTLIVAALLATLLVAIGLAALITERLGPPGSYWTVGMALLVPVSVAIDAPSATVVFNFALLAASAVWWAFDIHKGVRAR